MFHARGLNTKATIYTTRPEANGDTYSFYISVWMPLLVLLLVWLNLVVWGLLGLVFAVKEIVGWF